MYSNPQAGFWHQTQNTTSSGTLFSPTLISATNRAFFEETRQVRSVPSLARGLLNEKRHRRTFSPEGPRGHDCKKGPKRASWRSEPTSENDPEADPGHSVIFLWFEGPMALAHCGAALYTAYAAPSLRG